MNYTDILRSPNAFHRYTGSPVPYCSNIPGKQRIFAEISAENDVHVPQIDVMYYSEKMSAHYFSATPAVQYLNAFG